MFSRPGALYVGRVAVPGEVRLRRDRVNVVSHERERTVGTIEQDYFFDDVAAVSLTTPSLSRPRRTLRFDMVDGAVEHVWVQKWSDSFAQLERAFHTHRDAHPLPEGAPRPSRSSNDWGERVGTGDPAWVALGLLLLAGLGYVLNLMGPAWRWAGLAVFVLLAAVTAVRWRRRRVRERGHS